MPIYKLNGDTYDIPDDVVADFEKDNPSATITYHADGDEYEIPVSERDGFLKEFPEATTGSQTPGPGSTKQPMMDAMMQQKKADAPAPASIPTEKKKTGGYQPTSQELAGFQQTINNAGFTAATAAPSFEKKSANLQKRQGLKAPKRVKVGETGNLVEGEQRLNPDTGQLEQTYITSQGNVYVNKAGAEAEQRQIDDYERRMRYATGQAIDELGSKYINPLVDEALKKADEEWTKSMKESSSVPVGEGMEMFALRRANEKIDSDKILQGLQKTLEEAYKSPEMQKEISRLAESIGISKDEYLEQIVAPSLAARLENSFASSQISRNMPRNATEYILQGLSNSIGGMLMGAATETKGQRFYKNQAEAMTEQGNNPYYQPGTAASLAKMGVSFAADAPFFGVYGRVSGQVAKNIAERQISKMVAEGLSETAARSIVGTALENSVGARMKNSIMQHIVGGALTMGAYNATSETARQIRDKEGLDLGQIAGSTLEGLAVGSAFGVTGGAVQALSQPLSGFSKIGAKIAGFGAEAETMYATEELSKMAHGQEGFENPFEGSVEALMKLGVMKATGPDGLKKIAGEILHPIKSNQQQRTGIKFTDEEQAYVRNTQEGQKLIDALSQMHPGRAISEVNGKKRLTEEGEALRLQLSQNYEDFMNNKDIPASVKQKVAGVLGGVYRPGLETGADIIQNEDGSVLVKTRDKDGNCIQDLSFDNLAEAEQWRENHLSECRRNDAVNMWNNTTDQTRQEIVNVVKDQISGKTVLDEMKAKADGMKQNRLKSQLEKINQVAEQYEGRELTDEEARNFIQMVIRDGDDATFSEIYQLIHDKAYPKDMPDTKRNYWEGQQLTSLEKHIAQTDAQVAEERLMLQGEDFAKEVMDDSQYPDEKISELAARLSRGYITKDQFDAAVDYYNKMSKVNGMLDETLKDIDNQVEAANSYVRKNTHADSGSLIDAVYAQKPDRQYYVTAGHFEVTPDGKLKPTDNSGMVILRDKETGEIEVVSPSEITVSHIDDPNRVIAENESMEGLRGQLMKEADDVIDLHPDTPTEAMNGDIYTGADGKQYIVMQIEDETGNPVKVKMSLDEAGNPIPNTEQPLDTDEYRKAKSNEIDAASRPQVEQGAEEPAVAVTEPEKPANTPQNEADGIMEVASPLIQELETRLNEGKVTDDNEPPVQQGRIPVDEKGKKLYEQAKPEDTLAELTEKYGEEKAQQMISKIAESTAKELEKLQQTDTSGITDMNDLDAHETQITDLQKKLDYWNGLIKKPETIVEVDQEGKPFVNASNGTTTFGMIDASKNLDEAPIKLSRGDRSHGYEHIEYRHGDQIKQQGFKSVEDFVEFVANNYTLIKEGVDEGGNPNGTYLLQAKDKHNNTVYIELSKDGSYWNVNSGGVFRKNYGDKLKTVWSASEVQNGESAPDNTLRPTTDADKTVEPNGTVSNTVSDGKDTEKTNTNQENQQKNDTQQPVADQKKLKIYQNTVNNNIGNSFTFTHNNGIRSVLKVQRIDHDGNAVLTRQDYDAQGNPIGEAREERYNFATVGEAIVNQTWKKELSIYEKLQKYKYNQFKVGDVSFIDVLTEDELQQVLNAYERGDKQTVGNLTGKFGERHKKDFILRGRDQRNSNVRRIMEGNGSREDKLRRVRKEFQGYDDSVIALSDEALQPTTLEEYVADLHGRQPKAGEGPLAYFSYDQDGKKVVGMQDETGYGTKTGGDTRGFAPWLAPKGRGMSLQQYAENIHSQLPEAVQRQYSDQDVRNAILEVFGGAERPSDITTMVIKRGVVQAEQAARRMEEQWIDGGVSYQKVAVDENSFAGRLERAKQQTNTEPTEAQKEKGNYKKGHVSFGGYDFVVENPEGSMRRGTDADGKSWEQKMHNTYGYILGKYGKDGDHLDMFINDQADLDNWNGNVYIVDQVDPKTGRFDEHKVLYGFGSEAEARDAYLSNYEDGWQGLGRITGVVKETFDKWLDSSKRKLKEFADHSVVKDAAHKVETETVLPVSEQETVLRDAVVEHLRSIGVDVSTDWKEGQRILDEYNGNGPIKKMGSRTEAKKKQIASDLSGMTFSKPQQAIVNVFTGSKDRERIELSRKDGGSVSLVIRQGNDNKAGTKHASFRHYDINGDGYFTSDDILLIPEIVRSGERVVEGKRMKYTATIDGIEYTVATERKNGTENFVTFYTNRKKQDRQSRRTQSEDAQPLSDDALSGAKVQQNSETAKDSVRKFFKTPDGHAYGYTYKGKVYVDPRIATAETPVHEYSHLWAEMKRQTDHEEWDQIKQAMLNDKMVQPIIDRVRRDYPELAREGKEDDFIEEVITQFSGKRGAERLREIADEVTSERGGIFGKAEAVTAMQRLKNILNRFWESVARMMGWKYTNANQIADRIMADMLNGVNPAERMKEEADRLSEMRAYHGSAAEFDRFDHTKVGSGEGQAVSGYGTYVTSSEGTARYYANVASTRQRKVIRPMGYTVDGEFVRDPALVRAYDYLKKADGDVGEAIKACEHTIEVLNRHKDKNPFGAIVKGKSTAEEAMDYLLKEKEKPGTIGFQEEIVEQPDRQLYEVEIPDDTGKNYFDLDKKLTKKQKADIKKRFLEALDSSDEADYWKKNRDIIEYDWKQVDSSDGTGDAARGVMEQFLPSEKVSEIFSDMGYVGSKVKGSDGTTYIIYNADSLQIKDRMRFQMVGKEGAAEAPKFQREAGPEPDMTPEDRQYWNKWDAAMKKWKERNAIPADQMQAPEKPRYQQGESALDYAQKLVQWNRMKALWQTAPKLEDYRQVRDDKDMVEAARENEQRYPDSPSAKTRMVASDMMRLRHAMSRQKAYDKATVKAVTDFAQDFMKLGFGDNLSRGEMERMLSSVKNATGAKDIRKEVDNIMNILADNYLKNLENQVTKLSSVKELSKTAQGVEKQGRLELKGQRMIQAFRDAREKRMTLDQINERMAEVAEKMNRSDDEAPMWEQDYEGLAIARQYVENIEGSREEWADLDTLYKDAVKDYKTSGRSYKDQQEYLESLEQAMQENKIDRIGLYGDIIGRLQGNISESMQGAKEFVEREKQRQKHIWDMANFDLAGKETGAMREKTKGKPANFFLQPLGTFEQMLKQFGSRNANGEGYLYDYFMRNWMDATDKAFINEQKAKEELDAKAREVFGGKVKRWSDLYDISRSLPTLDVEVLDGEEPKTFKLTQGNLLYIYMADKMVDGRMKLRKMGIDEEAVEKIKDFMDPRLVQLGDWLQGEYLPQKRTEYNKVHERMFGAPMAAIDNYFPLKVLGDARYQEQDVNVPDSETLPSTITGNIIKRRKNALPLDILHTDALSLAIEHVEDMERWAAQAEWNKDINTLLSYTTFRNKVKNMDTIYGSGDALWNSFKDAAKMAAGTYNPSVKPGHVDAAISNIAKGVTAAKINFRVYTAFKQLLSAPAFLHDVNLADFAHDAVNPYGSWKWAMENMPVFQKRWKSRQVGDTRLMDDPTDWKLWKNNVVQMATRLGMSPNALVDGVTCAVGARSIYKSRYKKYKEIGASDEVAHKRALQDAEIGYNLTQQSSEGAFVSAIQKDRTVAANMLSVFRNSSMAYTRQWVDAARNLKKRAQKGYKEDSIKFMTRQMQEQFGIDEDQAKRAAELEYAREGRRDVARLLNMMFGVTVAWNLGASLPYLLIGDDDHTKKEMLTDALMKGMLAGPTEGLTAGNLYSDFIGRTLANEQTRNTFREEGIGAALDNALKQGGDYEVNPLPLMADIQSMIEKMGYDKYAAAQDVFNIAMQSAVGVNPQTFTDMWNAAMDYGAPGWDGRSYYPDDENLTRPKELALFMMRLMNAPTSSWRNKYIDELGMNAEDAQKLPYEEMARRYAHYKHWKDAPVMGWLRGEEARNEKIGKMQKQFDDAVSERMRRLTDDELMHNVARSESAEEKRRYAKIIAQRLGLEPGEDSQKADEKKNWYQNIYQRNMLYEDIKEDEMLADKYRNLENAFKEKREEAERKSVQDLKEFNEANKEWKERIAEAKKEAGNRIDWIRGGKWNTPSGKKGSSKKANLLAPGKKQLETGEDTEAIMKNIRQWRKEALEILMRAEVEK